MGKPRITKTPNKKGLSKGPKKGLAKSTSSPQDEDKKQTKISSFFTKSTAAQRMSQPSNSLLVPNLKKFSSKSKSLSSSSNALDVNLFCKKISTNNSSNVTNKFYSPDKIDDDSDIEIIESTPEANSRKEITFIKNSINTDSPEIIPATPLGLPSKSRVSLNNKFNLFTKNDLKSSRILGKSLNSTNKNKTSCLSKLSLKREAETKTGISPIAKRINETDKIVPDSCKKNLLFQINSPFLTDTSKSESEASFSILQPAFHDSSKQVCDSSKIINVNEMKEKEECDSGNNSLSDLIECNLISQIDNDEQLKDEEENLIEEEKEKEINQGTNALNKEELAESNENYLSEKQSESTSSQPSKDTVASFSLVDLDCMSSAALGHNLNTKQFIVPSPKQDHFEASFCSDDSLDKLLSDSFDKLSPFKDSKNVPKTVSKISPSVEKLLAEGLGSLSYSVKGNYGRYVVVNVERDIYKREALLHLISPLNRTSKYCTLSGFWYESAIKEGDFVHLLFTEEKNNKFYISNEKGIIVINPDFLISGTSVVSGVFCQRKSVLNERFKGYDSGNKIMILGSLVHQLFQEVVKKKYIDETEIKSLVENIITQPQVLKDFYGMNLTVEEILEEINKFIPLIKTWSDTYLETDPKVARTFPKNNWIGKVTAVKDIEENIWSPRFGIKGKIDLTIETKVESSLKIVPLELKTGKSSFSAEHKGQVTLYSMIMADRRMDPQSGLLLYLRDGSMAEVPAGEKEKKGLIQLRNEIVKYLSERPAGKEENELSLPSLPPPLDSKRTCNRCAHLLTCAVLQKANEEPLEESHAMKDLVPMTTAHLNKNHIEYFRKWCLMLHLEIGATDNEASIRSLWCHDVSKRESSGKCLSNMIVANDVTDMGNGYFVHKFIRQDKLSDSEDLPHCFQIGESVVVSSEKEIALTIGVVYGVEKYSLTLVLDKNLSFTPNNQKITYVIDRCEYQNNMSIFFTNISELLRNTNRSQRLRELIIDREQPQFNNGMDSNLVTMIRSILLNMNKEQQRAILKSVLAKDYVILKGYPGTGKTSTIVGLVRLLNATGYSILLTSYTHSAVDNILLKLKEYNDIKFLRLGKTSRIHKEILNYSDVILSKNMKTLPEIENFYNNAKIVATTCLGVGHVLFKRKSFDFCIMDEASQVLEAAALGPLFFCSKFILVGDSLQLPPVIKSQSAKNLGMMKSLFERLDNATATVCLSLQYRMNEPIMNVANQLIYEGQLKCGTEELKTATLENLKEINSADMDEWLRKLVSCELQDSFLMVDTLNGAPEERDCSGQIINPLEAKLIFGVLQMFLKLGVSYDDLGVITPYRSQVKYLQERMMSLFDGGVVEVNTVDQYQGRDKSVILYSCVRSGLSQEHVKKGEILNDIRRLNVAVTRAKKKLLVIGNLSTLRFYEPIRKLLEKVEKHQVYELKEGTDGFSWKDLKS